MQERTAQIVLLTRAFEEVDRGGHVLPIEERQAATRHARMVTTLRGATGAFPDHVGEVPLDETLTRRARLIFNALYRQIPSLYRVLEFSRLRTLMTPLVVGAALLIGLSANLLDPPGRMRLPSWPLLALIVWNATAFLLMGGAKLLQPRWARFVRRREWLGRHPLAAGLAGLVVRASLWRSRRGWKQASSATPEQSRVIVRSFIRYCALWNRLAGRLLEMRVRRMMHIAAMALASGVICGMYIRCVAFDFRATWQGSWVGPQLLETLTTWIYSPAAFLLQVRMPEVGSIYPSADDTATWFALHAWTALLVVVLPRLLLLVNTARRCSRMAHDLPVDLDEGYYRRLLES
jgi:hypothetical protein